MRVLRETQGRFRLRIKFWGLEGGFLPLVLSAALSALLMSIAAQHRSMLEGALAALPFLAVGGYQLFFITGRRPHFTRDVVNKLINGRSVSPLPPAYQPRHPSLKRTIRSHGS